MAAGFWPCRRHRPLRADAGRQEGAALEGGGGGLGAAPAPAPRQAAPEQQQQQQQQCRICWESTQEPSGANQLLSRTCACSGTLAFVHAGCLMEWQRHAASPGICATCRQPLALPPGLAGSVQLAPRWRQKLLQEAAEARQRPAAAAFRLWNAAVMCSGAAHAALSAHRAWMHAPAVAIRLRADVPAPLHRWQLLPAVVCAATWQAAWGPVNMSMREARWLLGHSASFAAGLVLECFSLRLEAALQPAALPAAAPGPAAPGARAAGELLPSLLGAAALVLQAAGMQHLHPFLALARGYHQGIHRAFHWTSNVLLLPLALMSRKGDGGGGGGAAGLAAAALRIAPVLAHGLFRALAMMRG